MSAAFAVGPTAAEMAEAAAGGATNGSEGGMAVGAGAGSGAVGVTNRMADDGETQLPIVKSEKEKIGRNEPCWCGSGKKFKFCHGAN